MDLLIVVTHRRWLVEQFADAATIRVVGDAGLDAPLVPPDWQTSWWAPMEHATRLRHAGIGMPLSAPGPDWLSNVPVKLTGRKVWTGTLADYRTGAGPNHGWAKPAEFKCVGFPAQWLPSRDDVLAVAAHAGIPEESVLQLTSTRLDLVEEHRMFIHKQHVVASSPYLDARADTWDPAWDARTDLHAQDAHAFAAAVLAATALPDGAVLDVGLCSDGTWVVVEANPAWASNR